MKRIWFGAALMVFLLILGICSSHLMEKAWMTQAEKLDLAAQSASDGDWSAARTRIDQAKQAWERHPLLIATLCDQGSIDQIDGLFAQLDALSEARSAASFSSTCVYLARQLEALGGSHSFTLENLL